MGTHNICFCRELKNINTFGLKEASYQVLYKCMYVLDHFLLANLPENC